MDPNSLGILKNIAEIVCAAFCIAIGSGAAALAQGRVIAQTTDAMARQPELVNELRFTMIIGLAMIESLAIYCLLISLILIFVKW
ncbi:MAG: ATP synthase F0 subunit C [Candidatus Riflebacteria bacterium]|nr:ATP synthase F0 subunit C [Candidatus Riflebacteria bacterium]